MVCVVAHNRPCNAATERDGIRVFARYLLDARYVNGRTVTVTRLAEPVACEHMDDDGGLIRAAMGSPRFMSDGIPATWTETESMTIWERGAGHILGSGTSSCAAVAVCQKLGLVDESITVEMPGGHLDVGRRGEALFLTGAVSPVLEGVLHKAWLRAPGRGASAEK